MPCVRRSGWPSSSLVFPVFVARLLHALGHHVHGLLERDLLPLRAVRAAVENVLHAMRAGDQLERRRAFRDKGSRSRSAKRGSPSMSMILSSLT